MYVFVAQFCLLYFPSEGQWLLEQVCIVCSSYLQQALQGVNHVNVNSSLKNKI